MLPFGHAANSRGSKKSHEYKTKERSQVQSQMGEAKPVREHVIHRVDLYFAMVDEIDCASDEDEGSKDHPKEFERFI